jgi:hypothetical protein
MSQQSQLLKQEMAVSQILRAYGRQLVRILKMVVIKQNDLCFSYHGRITRDHAVMSSGRPRHYYHKYQIRSFLLNSIPWQFQLFVVQNS